MFNDEVYDDREFCITKLLFLYNCSHKKLLNYMQNIYFFLNLVKVLKINEKFVHSEDAIRFEVFGQL